MCPPPSGVAWGLPRGQFALDAKFERGQAEEEEKHSLAQAAANGCASVALGEEVVGLDIEQEGRG